MGKIFEDAKKALEELEKCKNLAEQYLKVLDNTKQDIEKHMEQEASKEYKIEYPEQWFTWTEGGIVNGNYPFDAYDLTKWVDLGEVRATEEQAEEAIRRNIRGNRLEALAHSIGGVYEFIPNITRNFFVVYHIEDNKWHYHYSRHEISPERVYMNEGTAQQVVEILNSGSYKLNRKPDGK